MGSKSCDEEVEGDCADTEETNRPTDRRASWGTPGAVFPEHKRPSVTWVYTLPKPELQERLQRCGLETDGTLDVLRKRLVRFIREIGELPAPEPVPVSSMVTTTTPPIIVTTTAGPPPLTHLVTSTVTVSHPRERSGTSWLGAWALQTPPTQSGCQPGVAAETRRIEPAEHWYRPRPLDIPDRYRLPGPVGPGAAHQEFVCPPPERPSANRELPLREDRRHRPVEENRHWESLRRRTPSPEPVAPRQSTSTYRVPSPPPQRSLFERVRRWRVQFDGKTDPVAFIERISELLECSEVTEEQLLVALPEIFQGNALAWCRNNRSEWMSWEDFLRDFRSFFLPKDYRFHLEERIIHRKQMQNESGRDYVLDMQTLLRQHGNIARGTGVKRIYSNLLPAYRHYIRPSDFETIGDLMGKIQEYEELQEEMKQRAVRPAVSTGPPWGTPAYSGGSDRIPQSAARTAGPSWGTRTEPSGSDRVPRTDRRPPAITAGPPQDDRQDRRARALPQMEPRSGDSGPARNVQPGGRDRVPLVCWRCGEEGHMRSACRRPSRIFCSRCRRPDVLTRDCPCGQPEN